MCLPYMSASCPERVSGAGEVSGDAIEAKLQAALAKRHAEKMRKNKNKDQAAAPAGSENVAGNVPGAGAGAEVSRKNKEFSLQHADGSAWGEKEYVYKVVEVPVEKVVEKEVEKVVYIELPEKEVEKVVYIERPVYVDREVVRCVSIRIRVYVREREREREEREKRERERE